jgi:hypothetical protein
VHLGIAQISELVREKFSQPFQKNCHPVGKFLPSGIWSRIDDIFQWTLQLALLLLKCCEWQLLCFFIHISQGIAKFCELQII